MNTVPNLVRSSRSGKRDWKRAPAAMATGGEPQKQLLMLIRDFATEKSQGERRVSDLKRRLLDLQAESDAAALDLDKAKQWRESAELQLRAAQVQLSVTDASILALEARISLLQEEISRLGLELAQIKNKEGVMRDEFIDRMSQFNRKIRQFHETTAHVFLKQNAPNVSSDDGKLTTNKEKMFDVQQIMKELEDEITCTNARMHKLEGETQKELHKCDEVHQQVSDIERKGFLVEAVIKETKELQELSGRTSELEKAYAAVREELQRRYTCPSCQFNMEGVLEAE